MLFSDAVALRLRRGFMGTFCFFRLWLSINPEKAECPHSAFVLDIKNRNHRRWVPMDVIAGRP
jgi:hypothetical protein